MTREELRRYQRQELTVVFGNGQKRVAPLTQWIGAILYSLDTKQLGKVCARLDQLHGVGPIIPAPDPAAKILEKYDENRHDTEDRATFAAKHG